MFSLIAQFFELYELYYRLLGREALDRLCIRSNVVFVYWYYYYRKIKHETVLLLAHNCSGFWASLQCVNSEPLNRQVKYYMYILH